jgi:hypothetical protein
MYFIFKRHSSQITGHVKNATRLQGGWQLLVETMINNHIKKFLKKTLLDSYRVLVEKHKTLNPTSSVVFCPQINGCSDEEIQARFADQYIFKAYSIHKRDNKY